MTLVSQPIPNLLGGVSQKPATQRRANEASEQINGLSSFQKGLGKRPHTDHIALLEDDDSMNASAYVHKIERSSTDRFVVVLLDGALRVFDNETGAEVPVTFPDGVGYLASTDPEFDFRAVTVGDSTFITNRSILAQRAATQVATRAPEALVFIRQADYSTRYEITLDSTLVFYKTISGNTPDVRDDIATENIAQELADAIAARPELGVFAVERFGSTLYIKRTNGDDFSISGKDGLADGGMVVIKGSVQDFTSLPAFGKDGFIVEVTGEPGTKFDNYFVVYDDQNKPQQAGVWRECPKPGILLGFNPSTLPHELAFNGAGSSGASNGTPLTPNIYTAGGIHNTDGWATTLEGAESTDDEFVGNTVVSKETQHRYTELDALPNSTDTEITVTYDVIITAATGKPFGTPYANVRLYKNAGPGSTTWTKVSDKTYSGRGKWLNRQRKFTVNLPTGASIRATVETRGSPSADGISVMLHAPDPNNAIPGVQFSETPGKFVQFLESEVYPEGFNFVLTVDGDAYTYAALLDDTGFDVATALAALIDADPDLTATATDGLIEIHRISGTGAPTCVYSTTFDEDLYLFDPTKTFTPAAFVGLAIRNLSDNSAGVVTSNTQHVVGFSAGLAGGADNSFQRFDIYEIVGNTDSFVFREVDWSDREVGDDNTNPFPSFIGNAINEVFFYKGRLGFLSGENVTMSVAGDLFNFFRQTAKDVLDDDAIDVSNGYGNLATFHSAVLWNEGLYLVADNAQFRVTGSPLTPASIGLEVVGQFENSRRVRPLVLGDSIIACKEDRNSTRVWQFFFDNNGRLFTGFELTDNVPTYIPGAPQQIAGSAADGFFAILTDDNSYTLYVYSYKDTSDGRVMASWSKWTWPVGWTINGLAMVNSKLYLVHTDAAII